MSETATKEACGMKEQLISQLPDRTPVPEEQKLQDDLDDKLYDDAHPAEE